MRHWNDFPIKIVDHDYLPECFNTINKLGDKIYYRGEWDNNLFIKSITIVGSRRITKYGRDVIDRIVPALVNAGVTIISGFMYGVDVECHNKCLEFGGKTVAVVGGGLNQVANYYNSKLYDDILGKGGLIMSEYVPEFKSTNWSFPQRDRIMAAISSLGVLVIEGGVKSGSLITAKYALKNGKRVLAVPGPINSAVSAGTNWLIKSGAAKMVTEVGDIISEELSSPTQESLFKDYADLSKIELAVVRVLENEAVTADELAKMLKLPISDLLKTMSLMLMRDLVEEVGGKFYLS